MGKAARWLRGFLGLKRDNKNADQNSHPAVAGDRKEKNRWSFSKSGKEITGKAVQKLPPPPPRKAVADADWQRSYTVESEQHAIAVAAASAAAADAAVVAAQAAVAVVRLTNQGRGGAYSNGGKEIFLAALKIQNVFRGFLARKALRALRGLVKLQALVRGFLVRKRAAETLQSMQALIRAQTTVRSQRARRSNNKENKSQPEKSTDDDDGDGDRSLYSDEIHDPKIVEIDTLFKNPKSRARRFNSLLTELADERQSPYFWAMASPARFSGGEWCFAGGEECGRRLSTAHSTPRVGQSGWVAAAGAVTPARSVYGEGYFRPYSNYYPNYMASTKSFKAKLRSRSAPKQRPEAWTKKRAALNEIIGPRNSLSSVRMHKCLDHRLEGEEEFDEF